MSNDQEWLNTDQVAKMLGVKPGLVSSWRFSGRGPKFMKICRSIRYRLSDVQEFLAECEKVSERMREEGAEDYKAQLDRLKEYTEAKRKKREAERMAGIIEL